MRQIGRTCFELDQDQRGLWRALSLCGPNRSYPPMEPQPTALPSATAPRYTSYPTAPHFHAGIDAATFPRWLGELADQPVSLYAHIPYCDRLCWFCACHTRMTRQYRPVAEYLQALEAEIETVGAIVRGSARVKALHLGG